MNNKKLFKLVLFTSILIVISCGKKNLPSSPNLPSGRESSLTTKTTNSSTDVSLPKESDLSMPKELVSTTEVDSTSKISSIGTLSVNTYSTLMNLYNDYNIANSKSSIITVSGFSESFRKEVKSTADIKYVIREIKVTSVSSKSTTVEEVQNSIKDNALEIVNASSGRFDEIQIRFAGDKQRAEKNARDILSAINPGRVARITLVVEAFAKGNTAGKFYSSTFEVRFIMQGLV